MTTTARTVSDIAEMIREIDGDNTKDVYELAWQIQERLDVARVPNEPLGADLVLFMARTNPDKALTPDRLAELIVAEFELDKEN